MPIYEYRCNNCGHALDAIQRMADKPLRKCPQCKKLKLNKIVSSGGFILKGGGWHHGGHSAS